ncbi:MAG: UbiD family decarboxylase [Anaerolineaceae bacterium]|nr:UbiD family decarboxylase [Anaerolineaceae bacterium]
MSDFPDLRTFLNQVRSELPDQLLTISEEVPLDYTSTALTLELERRGRRPVLFFEHVQGQTMPLAANLFASRQVMALSIGVQPEAFTEQLGQKLDALIPAQPVQTGPVQEVVWEGSEADLTRLPIPRHFIQDAGPYITAGMLAARDPDTGIGNLAYVRLQVKGPRQMGASLHSRQHTWDYLRRAELRGQDLPVAVVIGAHPSVMLAAAAKMGIDQDEYDLAGALVGKPLPVCRCRTVDVSVPANAEIVIEGRLLANVHETEGPFGEYTGYVTGRSTHNVMEVTAITMRRDAVFVDIIPGNSAEHLGLGRVAKEAWLQKRMSEALPFFMDFHYPSSGTHFHCFIRIDKSAEGQAQQAAQLLVGLDHYVKLVIVVDKDIDPADEDAVMWAMATRMQADRDINILSHTICNRLDPSSDDGLGAKMLIDATRPKDFTAEPVRLPDEAVLYAERLLSNN